MTSVWPKTSKVLNKISLLQSRDEKTSKRFGRSMICCHVIWICQICHGLC